MTPEQKSKILKVVLIGSGIAVWIISYLKEIISKISYELSNLKLGKVTVDSTQVVMEVNIHNANTFAIPIPVLKGDLFAGGQKVGEVLPVGFVIPASGIVIVPLTISLGNKLLTGQLINLASAGGLEELFDGFVIAWKVTTKWGTFPYAQKIGVEY